MKRIDYYSSEAYQEHSFASWDGKCWCGHDYFNNCRGNCTCLGCNSQRQWEEKLGLKFEEGEPTAEE